MTLRAVSSTSLSLYSEKYISRELTTRKYMRLSEKLKRCHSNWLKTLEPLIIRLHFSRLSGHDSWTTHLNYVCLEISILNNSTERPTLHKCTDLSVYYGPINEYL